MPKTIQSMLVAILTSMAILKLVLSLYLVAIEVRVVEVATALRERLLQTIGKVTKYTPVKTPHKVPNCIDIPVLKTHYNRKKG